MFHKLLGTETEEFESISKATTEYKAIFDTLIDWLNESVSQMQQKIETDEKAIHNAWEGARLVAMGREVSQGLKGSMTTTNRFYSDFTMLLKRWDS